MLCPILVCDGINGYLGRWIVQRTGGSINIILVGKSFDVVIGIVADAGPGAIVSWVLAGICCVVSGLSYAELSSIIPSEGGAYAYAFVALGELPATITAWCLTLEVCCELGRTRMCTS